MTKRRILHAWAAWVDLNRVEFLDLLLPFLRFPNPAQISQTCGGLWHWQTYLWVNKQSIIFLFFLDIFAALRLNAAGITFLRLLEAVRLHPMSDFLDDYFKGGQLYASFDEPLDEGALVHAEDLPSQVPQKDTLKQMEKVDRQRVGWKIFSFSI